MKTLKELADTAAVVGIIMAGGVVAGAAIVMLATCFFAVSVKEIVLGV